MPLGIGNNLIRNGGGLNPDKLALDLQFAADKAYAADGTVVNGTGQFNITSRKGPPAKFTRGSGATFVDSDGLIKYAPENLLLWSEDFSIGTWSKSGVTVDANSIASPSGAVTADMIIENTANSLHGVRQTVTTPIGTSYAYSIYLKAAGRNFALIYSDAGSGFGRYISIPADGSGGVLGNANANDASVTLQYLSNGWYRATLLVTSTRTTTMIEAYASNNGTTSTYTGDGTSGIFLWGAQLERHTSARAYIPTTTAVAYAPRFDHDPVTLASRGLLIEEQRQNLVLQSENHPSASWNKTGVTISAVTQTAPDGNTNSNLVSEDSSTGLHRTFQGNAYVNGTSYAISVFLKFAGRQFVAITHPAVATNNIAIFDIQNGSVTLQQSGITASMVQYPNGWWRCVIVGTSSTTSSQSHIIQGSTTGGSLTGSYTGLNGAAFYIYGSQVEAGSFATSYIPTTTSALTRSADVCTIANTSSFWNSSEFTLFTNANWAAAGFDSYASNFSITNGFFGTRRPNTNLAVGIIRSSAVSADISFGAIGSFTTGSMRMALAHSTGQQAGSLNGASAIQQNSAFVPSSNPPFNIGYSGAGAYINGHVLAIRYYKKRLPNAKLQAITA